MTRPPDALAEIRKIYYATTKATVIRDLDRAIDLLKGLPDDDERETAAVYMGGPAQMRSEWGVKSPAPAARRGRPATGSSKAPAPPARPPRRGRAGGSKAR